MTDWNNEAGNLGSSDFWKPMTGQYSVKFLDNGTPSQYKDGDKVTDQMDFKVQVGPEQKQWTVTKAKTVNSLWGQIALIGQHHGSLEGKTITLFVKYDQKNNKRDYTIQEALSLQQAWNDKQKDAEAFMPDKEAPVGASAVDMVFEKWEPNIAGRKNINPS